jgi:hypothetical protein
MGAWLTDLNSISWANVVASYKLATAHAVTSIVVHREFHSIRRRRS